MKVCSRCKTLKPTTDFCKDKYQKDGQHRLCRVCLSEQNSRAYEKNRHQKHIEYHEGGGKEKYAILYRQNARRRQMVSRVSRVKRRGKKHGVIETFAVMDFEQVFTRFENKCFNCGTVDRDLQVDHHVPQHLGMPLTHSNAVILCDICNGTKGIQPPHEFYSVEQLRTLEVLGVRSHTEIAE